MRTEEEERIAREVAVQIRKSVGELNVAIAKFKELQGIVDVDIRTTKREWDLIFPSGFSVKNVVSVKVCCKLKI